MIKLNVPGVPIPQPRAKASHFAGRTRVYTPTTKTTVDDDGKKHRRSNGVAEFKALLKQVAAAAYTGPPLNVPLRVDVTFVFPRQQSKIWKSKPMPRYPHATRPDRDNLDKLLLDALSGIIWTNDWLVCQGTIEKWHASGDEQPHTLVTIEAIPAAGPVQKELL